MVWSKVRSPRAIQPRTAQPCPTLWEPRFPVYAPEAPCQRPGLSGPPNLVWGPNLDRSTAWGPPSIDPSVGDWQSARAGVRIWRFALFNVIKEARAALCASRRDSLSADPSVEAGNPLVALYAASGLPSVSIKAIIGTAQPCTTLWEPRFSLRSRAPNQRPGLPGPPHLLWEPRQTFQAAWLPFYRSQRWSKK